VRFAQAWTDLNGGSNPIRQYSNRQLTELANEIHHWQLSPSGTEGFRKAEVMAGGVDTDELSSQTLESRKIAGLYFIGEVVDVTGHLGGFNFQWAWASGFAAGQAM
jgi:predicted flavoprotein YhiN